jgi:hypothetical protein
MDFGFVHFCPKVKLGREHSPATHEECSFFLAVAYAVLSCVKGPPLLSTKKQKKSVKDDLISPWFGNITEFHNLLKNEVKYTFERQLDYFKSSVNQAQLRRKQLLQQYALLRSAINTNMTKIYAVIFWIDFCVCIVPYPTFIQKVASWCPRIAAGALKIRVNTMVVSVFQVMDRIAETQQRRGLTCEYNDHSAPAGTTMTLQNHVKDTQIFRVLIGVPWN